MNRCPEDTAASSWHGARRLQVPAWRAGAVVVLVSCAQTPNTTFELDLPSAVAANAAWYEVGVVAGVCPSSALLAGGIPSDGTVARLAFAASSKAPPGLGILPKQSYGIAAVARSADCTVIATGCSETDVSGGGTIAIALAAVPGGGGACAGGTVCEEATCVPSVDAAAPALGASCSLGLVGAGPLGDPLAPGTTLLSAPGIAATPTGFLLAYREFDSSGGDARLTTIAIDPGGGAAAPLQTSLPGSCVGGPQMDATALAFAGTGGTIALSRPACPGGGNPPASGLDLFAVDADGTISSQAFSGQVGLQITLAQAHALAYTPAGLLLAYTNQATQFSFAATVMGTTLSATPPQIPYSNFGGLATDTSAFVVAADLGTGFLALGAPGIDGGSGTWAAFASQGHDAGSGGDAASAAASTYPAKWASAGGVGSRVIVASNGPSDAKAILWTAYDIGTISPASSGTFAPENGGTVSFVDVALHEDHAFFIAEVDQTLSLFAFEKASTFPIQLREIPFASQAIIPVGALRDGLVAIAASDTRVAVVWGTGQTLGADDDVGGYALFACTP